MDSIIIVGSKDDAELARETLLVKRLRAACATLAKAQEDRRPMIPRERPRRLSRIQREFLEEALGRYVLVEDSEAFLLEMEQKAEEAQGKQD